MTLHAYAITVEGLPVAFSEASFPASELSAWDSVISTILDISEGEVTLDLGARRQIGSGFGWTMRDDAAHSLRTLIAPRQDPVGWLVEASIPGNTTTIGLVEVSDTSTIPNPFYLGAETLEYNGTASGPPRLANVSRALHGSTAQKFYGSDDDGGGAAIYAQIPRWSGRTVTLWESQRDEAGTMGAKTAIATARLEDSPSFLGEDRWAFEAQSLAQWYAQRPIFQGFAAVPLTEPHELGDALDMSADDKRKLWDGSTEPWAFLMADLPDDSTVPMKVASSTSTSITPLIPFSDVPTALKPVFAVQGDPVDLTLGLLGSKLGNGALGTWDVYAGLEPDSFAGVTWHVGAGIHGDDLDVAAFESFRGDGPSWTVVLDEQTSAESILMEFCQAVGAFWYVDATGRVSVTRLQERSPPSSSALSLTDALWLVDEADRIGTSEATVHHSVRFAANWDFKLQRHATTVTVVDAPARQEAPFDDRILDLASKFVGLDVGQWNADAESPLPYANPLGRVALETQLRRVQQYSKRPSAEITTKVPLTSATKAVTMGSIIDVTNARIPDMTGGVLDAQLAQVIGRQRHYETGAISLRARVLDAGFLLAPAVKISAAFMATGDWYITCTFPDWCATNDVEDLFAEGWTVTNTLGTFTGVLSYVGSTNSLIVDTPTGTPTVGDILVPVYGEDLDANALGFKPPDFAYCVNDAGTSAIKTRWS